jgi:hypothetical protein
VDAAAFGSYASEAYYQVTTTVSPRNFKYVKQLGADEVIDYHEEKFENAVSGVHAVLDTVVGAPRTRPASADRVPRTRPDRQIQGGEPDPQLTNWRGSGSLHTFRSSASPAAV